MRGLCFFFLSILTQVSSKTLSDVIGVIGHNVTLPCRYDTQTHGVLSFCWGQGKVPRFKCSRPILSSQHGAVQFRQSSRYQLLGRVTDGDMSLTILNAQWSDAGVYGCRVEIPGWFNDYKVNTHLAMEEAPVEHPVTQDSALATGGRHEIWTTSAPKKEKFKAFLRVGNIGRMGAIFFSSIIIILVFTFRRRFQPGGTPQRLNHSAAENIYERLPVPE
ncbi:T-cell immunoglobulin and mucin domain-containing protein 4-like isoform X2 [Xiphias gladius]|uniref:T-cell immunoglobulin and mucin domain-containing protein 4-like isoform X2 n=1 Tax=Xiphias gladius TaxID=8245 RepID=UPI001A99B363|nr:T-cell immunoglobulin and mucin domain-containing protein 4-like isoform X2 [Xiphias gladius]